MNESLKHTPLIDWHRENGGRLVDFAGWAMPVQYGSIVKEHQNVRRAIGVFDVSHMGRFRFDGADAGAFLDGLLTRRVVDMPLGRIRYSLVTNEQGSILDDVLVYRMETPSGRQYYLLVVNASNREKIAGWIEQHRGRAGGDVEFSDRTEDTAMIAVQGPKAVDILAPLFKADISSLRYYTGVVTEMLGRPCTVSRTGYTGEDGFELIVRDQDAIDTWRNIFRAGRDAGIAAAGLGARDTLRLEAAMPLYGHELSESINPYMAGLGFAVNLRDRQFVGCDALAALKTADQPRRIGLELAGRRVAREHCPVFSDAEVVGEVTSGTFSPTLEKPIAMAYVSPAAAQVGRTLQVQIRGRQGSATVVELPFYHRSS